MEVVELLVRGIEWWSCWHEESSGEAATTVSGRGGATAMAWRRCALLCSGVGERARCESEMKRAVEAHDLSLHVGLTGRASIGVWLPRGMPGLPPVSH